MWSASAIGGPLSRLAFDLAPQPVQIIEAVVLLINDDEVLELANRRSLRGGRRSGQARSQREGRNGISKAH